MTTAIIILTALLVAALWYAAREDARADMKAKDAARKAVANCYREFPDVNDNPKTYSVCSSIGEYVVVAQYYKFGRYFTFALKRFDYDIKDPDDQEFAHNCAIELLDKLNEK